MAAQTMRFDQTDAGYSQRLWSLAVFYESYLCYGAEGTEEEFGPKEPVQFVLETDEAA